LKKVLIVDDTKNIRSLLSTCLEMEGFAVATADNGRAALELFQTDRFDLAFLDIKLPEMSGTEVLRRIRGQGIQTPVVIMTAFATIKNAVECTRLGAVAYLQKPFTADKVRSILTEISPQNEVPTARIAGYLAQAQILLEAGQLTEAFNLAKSALVIDPVAGSVYQMLAQIARAQGDLTQARQFQAIAAQLEAKPS
jgi:DNA-binding NtrC family response regulator